MNETLKQFGFDLVKLNDDVFYDQEGYWPHIFLLQLDAIEVDIETGVIEKNDYEIVITSEEHEAIFTGKTVEDLASTIIWLTQLNGTIEEYLNQKEMILKGLRSKKNKAL